MCWSETPPSSAYPGTNVRRPFLFPPPLRSSMTTLRPEMLSSPTSSLSPTQARLPVSPLRQVVITGHLGAIPAPRPVPAPRPSQTAPRPPQKQSVFGERLPPPLALLLACFSAWRLSAWRPGSFENGLYDARRTKNCTPRAEGLKLLGLSSMANLRSLYFYSSIPTYSQLFATS